MQERIVWLDWAKSIGIFLVVLGHAGINNSGVQQYIYSFHMPLFFILSGYLDRGTDSLKSGIKKSIKTLLRPYLCFYLLSYLLWLYISYYRHPEIYGFSLETAFVKPMLGLVYGIGYDTPCSIQVNSPLWFLVALFGVKFCFNLIRETGRKSVYFISLLGGLFVYSVFYKHPLYFAITQTLLALPFYFLGNKLNVFRPLVNKPSRYFWTIPVIFLFSLLLNLYNGRVDMNSGNYGRNIIAFYCCGAFGSGFIILLSLLLNKYKNFFVYYISSTTLIIMSVHYFLIPVAIRLFSFDRSNMSIGEGILISLCTLMLSVPVSVMIKRFIPWMTGGKKKPFLLKTGN